jgi:hypothetical protein
MQSIVGLGMQLKHATTRDIQARIDHVLPSMAFTDQCPEHTRLTAVVNLLEDGQVTYGFEHPTVGHLPLDDDPHQGNKTILYVRLMLLKAMQEELESLEQET